MTREEAARILDPETTRDELLEYDADTRLAVCDEACRIGADALRAQQERENPKPITNADRIRAMSDEEMADMLWKTGRNYRAICADPVVDYNEQHEHLIDWLQQPAEEG